MRGRPSVSLGHVHLKVRELERAVDFYAGRLGLAVTERDPRMAFLAWGERHHDVALRAAGPEAAGPSDGVGLYHVAFEVEDETALRAVHRDLLGDDVAVDPVDHGISEALYFSDPDGNGVEVYADTGTDDDLEWSGRSKPFDPDRPNPGV